MTRHEEITAQCERAEEARATLQRSLDHLADAAKAAARFRGTIEDCCAAFNRVREAEEAYDLALLDVATARGEDA